MFLCYHFGDSRFYYNNKKILNLLYIVHIPQLLYVFSAIAYVFVRAGDNVKLNKGFIKLPHVWYYVYRTLNKYIPIDALF